MSQEKMLHSIAARELKRTRALTCWPGSRRQPLPFHQTGAVHNPGDRSQNTALQTPQHIQRYSSTPHYTSEASSGGIVALYIRVMQRAGDMRTFKKERESLLLWPENCTQQGTAQLAIQSKSTAWEPVVRREKKKKKSSSNLKELFRECPSP